MAAVGSGSGGSVGGTKVQRDLPPSLMFEGRSHPLSHFFKAPLHPLFLEVGE